MFCLVDFTAGFSFYIKKNEVNESLNRTNDKLDRLEEEKSINTPRTTLMIRMKLVRKS